MQASAALIREWYLKKPVGKSNVAIAEVYLYGDVAFCAGATSRGGCKSPIPQLPTPKSAGGQFEPSIDSRTGRLMDTDAEYKVLSEIAHILEMFYDLQVKGKLYLYTEFQPCESCNSVLKQFEEKFPHIEIEVFWNYPYPP
ncbi:deaminase domain-containing protein [Anabaena sp. CA = ATCC 33047]|uniref:deaminase domain-containing protein n=1 Tax=Anabaena sp. (strain CA / ATCC 33047) TaxID=52271 RepID=UPI000A713224|nr:deaminase domain-containing protein [Anabaena sp. CA = ATCC 33047]